MTTIRTVADVSADIDAFILGDGATRSRLTQTLLDDMRTVSIRALGSVNGHGRILSVGDGRLRDPT